MAFNDVSDAGLQELADNRNLYEGQKVQGHRKYEHFRSAKPPPVFVTTNAPAAQLSNTQHAEMKCRGAWYWFEQHVRAIMGWDEDKAVDDSELTTEYRTTPRWLATLVGHWLDCKYGEYLLGNAIPVNWASDDLESRVAFRDTRRTLTINKNNTASVLPYVQR